MDITPKEYVDLGASAVIVLSFVALIFTVLKGFKPILKKMESNSVLSAEIIRNNTAAFDEMAKSNNNVAQALQLLQNNFSNVTVSLAKQEKRGEEVYTLVTKLDERTNACLKA